MTDLELKVRAAIDASLENNDNYDDDGEINWSFVDADLWMDGVITDENSIEAMQYFNDYADEIESAESEEYDDSMDGDFDSAMASAGYGTDEDYGYYDGEC